MWLNKTILPQMWSFPNLTNPQPFHNINNNPKVIIVCKQALFWKSNRKLHICYC